MTARSSIVEKCVKVMDILADRGRPMGFTELVAKSGYPKSSVHRLLAILQAEELVSFSTHRGGYGLGSKPRNWAREAWRGSDLQFQSEAAMEALAKETGHNVALAILDADSTLYLRTIDSYPVKYAPRMGEHAPVHCTAVGKILAAFLPTRDRDELVSTLAFEPHTADTITEKKAFVEELELARQRGFAVSLGEEFFQTFGLAAPIRDHNDYVIAGVCLWGLRNRLEPLTAQTLAQPLCSAAREISLGLGARDD